MKVRLFVLATSGILLGFFLVFFGESRPRAEMFKFDHSKHQALACQVCHQGVMTQEKARVPTTSLCAKCHATSPDTSQAGLSLWRASEKNELRWPVSYTLPAHAYFSHQRHVLLAKLKCEECHGKMSSQKSVVTVPLMTLDMDRCLACHRKENATTDCARCHR